MSKKDKDEKARPAFGVLMGTDSARIMLMEGLAAIAEQTDSLVHVVFLCPGHDEDGKKRRHAALIANPHTEQDYRELFVHIVASFVDGAINSPDDIKCDPAPFKAMLDHCYDFFPEVETKKPSAEHGA